MILAATALCTAVAGLVTAVAGLRRARVNGRRLDVVESPAEPYGLDMPGEEDYQVAEDDQAERWNGPRDKPPRP